MGVTLPLKCQHQPAGCHSGEHVLDSLKRHEAARLAFKVVGSRGEALEVVGALAVGAMVDFRPMDWRVEVLL